MVDLSIIIINYNTAKLTGECIESVLKKTKNLSFEIIVVDNASTDTSVSEIKKLLKKHPIKLIQNNANLGFAKANNLGIKRARGKYILLLNSDTKIKNNIFSQMLSWMDENEKVGVVSCAIKGKDGNFQGAGGYFPNLLRIVAWMFFLDDIPFLDFLIKPFHPVHARSFYKGSSYLSKKHEKDWISGTFFLSRKEVFQKVGGFDEDYFMYVEDVDLCFRIKKAGWKVFYLPNWSILHLGGASSAHEFPIISEYKGIEIFYKKHMASWQLPILRLFLKSGAFLRMILFGVLKGEKEFEVYAKAYKLA